MLTGCRRVDESNENCKMVEVSVGGKRSKTDCIFSRDHRSNGTVAR